MPLPGVNGLPSVVMDMLQKKAQETAFQNWYKSIAAKTGLSPNPDDPSHGYDYRAAFKAGANPQYIKDTDIPGWYWPSDFKAESNPRKLLSKNKNGAPIWPGQGPAFNTITGQWLTEDEAKKQ